MGRKLSCGVLITLSVFLGVQCTPRKKLVSNLIPNNQNRRSNLLSSTLLTDYWKERGFHDSFTDHLIASESQGKDVLLSGDELEDFRGAAKIRIPRGRLTPPGKLPSVVSLTASVSIPKRIRPKRPRFRANRRKDNLPLTKAQRKQDMEILESVTLVDGGVPTEMGDGTTKINVPETPRSQRKLHKAVANDPQESVSFHVPDESYIKDEDDPADESIQTPYYAMPPAQPPYYQPQYQGKPASSYKEPKSLSSLIKEHFQREILKTYQTQPHHPPGHTPQAPPQPPVTPAPDPGVIPLYLIPKSPTQQNYQHPPNPAPQYHQQPHPTPYSLPPYPQPAPSNPQYSQPAPPPSQPQYSHPPPAPQPQYSQPPTSIQSQLDQPSPLKLQYSEPPTSIQSQFRQPSPAPSQYQEPSQAPPQYREPSPAQQYREPSPAQQYREPSPAPQYREPSPAPQYREPSPEYREASPAPPQYREPSPPKHQFAQPPEEEPLYQYSPPSPPPPPSQSQSQLFRQQQPSSSPFIRQSTPLPSFRSQLFQQQFLHPFATPSAEPSPLAQLTASILSTASGAASVAAKALTGDLPSLLQSQVSTQEKPALPPTNSPHLASPMLSAAASIQSSHVLIPTTTPALPTPALRPGVVLDQEQTQAQPGQNQLIQPEELAKKLTTIYETGKKILYFPKGVIDTVDTLIKQMERNPMVSYWGDKFFAKVFGDTSGT